MTLWHATGIYCLVVDIPVYHAGKIMRTARFMQISREVARRVRERLVRLI